MALIDAIDFSDFDSVQKRWTHEEVHERLAKYLQKDAHIGHYLKLSEEALTLYDVPESQDNRCIEYVLRFAEEKQEPVQKKRGLLGAKIALDPGHFGGKYARLEQRFIDLPPSLDRVEQIQFDEGTLSYLTALYLKTLLEKEGAIVYLTREGIGKGGLEQDFFAWLAENSSYWFRDQSLKEIFRKYYNPLDLRARAKKINAFSPDLTIVIHYNSHEPSGVGESNHTLTSQNFNMVFVPGAFCRNELAVEEARYEFLRLLATADLPESVALSKCILTQFSKHLSVPCVSPRDNARYLDNVCMSIDEGIYARNLALTRLVHGPVCYGETLVQNNIDECTNLSRKDFVIGGILCSSRIKQVAEAYFAGIKLYLEGS